jgi:hypothetical protein
MVFFRVLQTHRIRLMYRDRKLATYIKIHIRHTVMINKLVIVVLYYDLF